MSLTSWALVMSPHHRMRDNLHAATSIWSWRARHAGHCCSPSDLLAGPDGLYGFEQMLRHPSAGLAALCSASARGRAQSRPGAAACLAAARSSGGAEPRLRGDERGVMTKVAVYGFVRIVFDLLGEPPVVERVCSPSAASPRDGRALRADEHDLSGCSPITPSRISGSSSSARLDLAFRRTAWPGRRRSPSRRPAHVSITRVQSVVLRRRSRAHGDRRARHGASRRPDPSHAANRVRVPDRLRRDLGAASLNGLRVGMASPSGILVSPQLPSWGLKFLVPAVGGCWRCRPPSPPPCFVKPSALRSWAARARRRRKARRRPTASARGDVLLRGALPSWRDPARRLYRCAGGPWSPPGRRPHAVQSGRAVALDRLPIARAQVYGGCRRDWRSGSSPSIQARSAAAPRNGLGCRRRDPNRRPVITASPRSGRSRATARRSAPACGRRPGGDHGRSASIRRRQDSRHEARAPRRRTSPRARAVVSARFRRRRARAAQERKPSLDEAGGGEGGRQRQQRADAGTRISGPMTAIAGSPKWHGRCHSDTKPLRGGSAETGRSRSGTRNAVCGMPMDQAAEMLHVALAGRREHGSCAENNRLLNTE